MVVYKGGMASEKGSYWSPLDGRHATVQEDGVLPGDDRASYLKISPALLLVIAPLFGMMYVVFLPLFGIGVFIISWLVPVMGALSAIAITGLRVNSGRSAFFTWNPSRAYLSGSRKNKKTGSRKKQKHSEGNEKGKE
jgi:hypothetical protein